MMDNKSFDEHVRDQFSGYSPEVPAHIWDKIMSEKDRKKPAAWLFFLKGPGLFLLCTLLLASGGVIFFNSSPNESAYTTLQNTTAIPATEQNKTADAQSSKAVDASTIPVTMSEPPAVSSIQTHDTDSDNKTVKKIRAHQTINIKGANTSSSARSKPAPDFSENVLLNEFNNDFILTHESLTPQKSSLQLHELKLASTWIPALPIPCPGVEDNAAGNKRYFEIYGSADKPFRSFTDTGNSGYLQSRKQTTSTELSFSAGIRYTRVFNNGMSIRAGINFSQINEKFTYSNGHVVQMVYILNSNGDTTGSYIQSGTRYKSSINKYRTLDIPLLIGYELGNGRLHANINAGPVLNVYSWQKGSLLDTAGNIIDITTGKGESPYHFRKNIGVSFMGAVSAYYKLNDRFHLVAEPYFRYNFSPVSKPEMTFKQKYNTAGIRLGLRMDF